MPRFREGQFQPRLMQRSVGGGHNLDNLLQTPYDGWGLVCFHNWVYWKYGDATKMHRICNKCYKKQKNAHVLNKYHQWIKDTQFE